MNDLREQCLKIIESLEETIESNGFGYSCLNEEKAIHLLEAFVLDQQIKVLMEWLDAEIQRMREEGEHVHSGESRYQ